MSIQKKLAEARTPGPYIALLEIMYINKPIYFLIFICSHYAMAGAFNDMQSAADQNAKAAKDDSQQIEFSEITIDDGEPPLRAFIGSMNALKPQAAEKLIEPPVKFDPSAKYFSVVMSNPYLNFAMGKQSFLRLMKVKDGKLFWVSPEGKESEIKSVKKLNSKVGDERAKCSCGMNAQQLMQHWQEKPELPPYLKNKIPDTDLEQKNPNMVEAARSHSAT